MFNFGKSLKKLLKKRKITPYQLAKDSGVSTPRIYGLLNRKMKYPRFNNFFKMAKALNLPPWKFLKILCKK